MRVFPSGSYADFIVGFMQVLCDKWRWSESDLLALVHSVSRYQSREYVPCVHINYFTIIFSFFLCDATDMVNKDEYE